MYYPPVNTEVAIGEAIDAGYVRGAMTSASMSQRHESLQKTIDNYYDALARKELKPSLYRNSSKFFITKNGKLRIKAYPSLSLAKACTSEPLTFTILTGNGEVEVIDFLGFTDWETPKRNLPSKTTKIPQASDSQLAEVEAKRLRGWRT